MSRPRSALRTIPFALAMAAAVLCTALAQGTLFGELPPEARARWAFHADRHLYTLVTSVFLVSGPFMLARILLHLAYTVAVLEWRAGTRRTLLVFWGVHLATSLVEAVALPPGPSGSLGLSGGGAGCMGAWVRGARASRRWLLPLVAAAFALKVLAAPDDADAIHAVAFTLGFLAGGMGPGSGPPREAGPRSPPASGV